MIVCTECNAYSFGLCIVSRSSFKRFFMIFAFFVLSFQFADGFKFLKAKKAALVEILLSLGRSLFSIILTVGSGFSFSFFICTDD